MKLTRGRGDPKLARETEEAGKGLQGAEPVVHVAGTCALEIVKIELVKPGCKGLVCTALVRVLL